MKEVKNLDNKRYKTVLREYKDKNKWKDIPCSWIGRLNIVKMSVLLKASYRFNALCMEISAIFFVEIEKAILNFVWNVRGPE